MSRSIPAKIRWSARSRRGIRIPKSAIRGRRLHAILTEAIDELAPIYRTVFTLRDVDGLSTEETAEALELTVPAVKSRLLRARLQLRDKLTRFFKRKGDDAFAYM